MRIKSWIIVLFTAVLSLTTILPAYANTITVTTLADVVSNDGSCSLREAISNANNDNNSNPDCGAGSGADTINLSVTGSYTLTGGIQLDINSTITIQESNGATAVIEAATTRGTAGWRVFNLSNATSNLTLTGITVRHGNIAGGSGGCIQSNNASASLTLNGGTIVEACDATVHGGGVFSNGVLTINTVTIQDNRVTGGTGTSNGGGIYSIGTLTINTATIHNNQIASATISQGGGVYFSGSAFSMTNGTFTNNTAQGTALSSGGGLFVSLPNVTSTISGSSFSGNQANNGSMRNRGGGIFRTNLGTLQINTTSFVNNSVSGADAIGGGLYTNQGSVSVTTSRFEQNNAAAEGDAYYASSIGGGSDSVTDSCIVGNGDTAVFDTSSASSFTATDNWWGDPLGAYPNNPASLGDSVQDAAVNVSSPKGAAPSRAGATCLTCTEVSSIRSARVCTRPS